MDLSMIIAYSALGLWLSLDPGLAPWHWQFCQMFTPLFLAGEMAIHILRSDEWTDEKRANPDSRTRESTDSNSAKNGGSS